MITCLCKLLVCFVIFTDVQGVRIKFLAIENFSTKNEKGFVFNECAISSKGLNLSFTCGNNADHVIVSFPTFHIRTSCRILIFVKIKPGLLIKQKNGSLRNLVKLPEINWCADAKKAKIEKNQIAKESWIEMDDNEKMTQTKCPSKEDQNKLANDTIHICYESAASICKCIICHGL